MSPEPISSDGVRALFLASRGVPRTIDQVALQAVLQAVVSGQDEVGGALMKRDLHAHPLFQAAAAAQWDTAAGGVPLRRRRGMGEHWTLGGPVSHAGVPTMCGARGSLVSNFWKEVFCLG